MIRPSCCLTRQYGEGPTSTISGGSDTFPRDDMFCLLIVYALYGYIPQNPHEVQSFQTLRIKPSNLRVCTGVFPQELGAHLQDSWAIGDSAEILQHLSGWTVIQIC